MIANVVVDLPVEMSPAPVLTARQAWAAVLLFGGAATTAMAAVAAAGFWREGAGVGANGVGPDRWPTSTSTAPLWAAALAGVAGFVLPQLIYGQTLERDERPGDVALMTVSALAAAAGLATLLIATAWRTRQATNPTSGPPAHPVDTADTPGIGLSIRRLPAGVLRGVAAWVVLTPVVAFVGMLNVLARVAMGRDVDEVHPLLDVLGRQPELAALLLVSAAGVVPLFEELLFRGHVQTGLSARLRRRFGKDAAGRWGAVLLTSLVFTVIHPWFSWPQIFVLSVGLGVVYERWGNLWVPITVHALFNGSQTLLFLLTRVHSA